MAGPVSSPPDVAALLLTGGASRRMGRHKATIVIDGEELASRTAILLGQIADPVLEVGSGYTSLPRTQEDPPRSGPLAAVAAGAYALQRLHHRGAVLVVATDLPRLTAAFLRNLAGHTAASPLHSVVPRDSSGRPQPLCARYSTAALAQSQTLVAAGRRSMGSLLERLPITWLDLDLDVVGILGDVDTPEDLTAPDLRHRVARP